MTKKGNQELMLTKDDLIEAAMRRLLPVCEDYYGERQTGLVQTVAKEVVDKAFGAEVKKRVQAAVDAEIQSIMAEGFTTTDGYGKPTGKKTLKEMLLEHAYINPRDCYHNPIVTAVRGFVEKECKAELDRIRTVVREQANELIGGKLIAALREGLGLK